MRERLQRAPFDYQTLRDNRSWYEHDVRLHLIAALIATTHPKALIDPAAGDGSLEELAEKLADYDRITVGDISRENMAHARELYGSRPGWSFLEGDVNQTLEEAGPHDLVILSEILEHLEDPDTTLRLARRNAAALIASSPIMRPGQVDSNDEHLWMFDEHGYRTMLEQAGWEPQHSTILRFRTVYDFQIWVCA